MAVSLNYILPATGAVAPTAAQMVNQNMMIVDVTATADADTTATIPHLMTGYAPGFTTPLVAIGQQILSQALAVSSGWSIAAPGTANVVCTKLTTAGSGNALAQLRVTIMKPFSGIE